MRQMNGSAARLRLLVVALLILAIALLAAPRVLGDPQLGLPAPFIDTIGAVPDVHNDGA